MKDKNMIPKTKILTQHVQENLENNSQIQRFSHKHLPAAFLRFINATFASVASVSARQGKQQNTPQLTAMSDLLTGRFRMDVSQHSLAQGEPETKPAPGDNQGDQPIEESMFPNQRARLFARLGIKGEQITALPEDIELLIASLSHIEERKRIESAYAIADLYEKLPPAKQMHARINLILMTWRDANTYARIAAIKALARTGTSDVSEALQIALRDEEQDVRAAAARALGEIHGNVPVVALIFAAMRENEHWSVRAAAVHAMGSSGDHAFLSTINRALDDEDDSVRIAAIQALAQLEGIQAAPRLALIARQDKQPHVKHAAILELEDLSAGAN